MNGALPELFVLRLEATLQPKYGHNYASEVRDSLSKPGRRTFRRLFALRPFCWFYRFSARDCVTDTAGRDTLVYAQPSPGERRGCSTGAISAGG